MMTPYFNTVKLWSIGEKWFIIITSFMATRQKIDISLYSIIKVALLLLALWFLYLIKEVVGIVFVAIILASAVDPMVSWLQRGYIPRKVGIIIVYFILFGMIGGALTLLVPALITQTQKLMIDFPTYWANVTDSFNNLKGLSEQYGLADNITREIRSLEQSFAGSGNGLFSTVSSIFGSVVAFFVVLVITFYLVTEENAVKKILRYAAPAAYQPFLTQLLYKMRDKIGLWLRGQILLSLIVGLLTYGGLNLLGFVNPALREYALVLALMGFVGEFIPYVGPIIAAIPAVFIAFTISPPLAIVTLGFYLLMQWAENNILVPKVMQRFVGLNPIISIVALLIGARVGGFVGVILAIPVATAVMVLLEEIYALLDERDVAV